jgi:hypothetical protein
MFMALYIFPVPRSAVGDFLRIQAAASSIYREHGALEDVTYAPVSPGAEVRLRLVPRGFSSRRPTRTSTSATHASATARTTTR